MTADDIKRAYLSLLSLHVQHETARRRATERLAVPLADDATTLERRLWASVRQLDERTLALAEQRLQAIQQHEQAFAKALDRDADVLFAKDILRNWAGEILTDPDQRRAWLL